MDRAIELAGLDVDAPVMMIRESTGGLLGLLGATTQEPAASLPRLDPQSLRTWLAEFLQVQLEYRISYH